MKNVVCSYFKKERSGIKNEITVHVVALHKVIDVNKY